MHVSSGCIYQGDNGGRGFSEEDPPNFMGSFYSRTKAWADQILKDFPVLQLRIRMPFGDTLNDRSLITKISRYERVLDVPNSLTYLPDFLGAARVLIERRRTGLYNVVNPGVISPYAIMQMYQEIVDPAHRFERLTLDHLPDVVKAGRSNCTLSTQKLAQEGIALLPVPEAVERALRAIAGAKK
jgi:dTDP-4-dehydrorhamnose reductase